MKFGKNLEAGIEQKWKTWRSYALRYNSMKRLLPDMDDVSDIQSFHEDPNRRDAFWRTYDKCLQSLQTFYEKRLEASTEKLKELQHRFETLRQSKTVGGNNFKTSEPNIHSKSIEQLTDSIVELLEETDLILEFLEINRTACRKILKKYDKRTQSSVKEERMAKLLETHGFLFGGSNMTAIKFKANIILQNVKQMKSDYKATEAESSNRMSIKVPKFENLPSDYLEEAQYILEEVEKSSLFSTNRKRQNAVFSRHEIEIGDYLGEGEFGIVHEIKSFHVKDTCPICFLHRRSRRESQESSSGEITSEAVAKILSLKQRSSSLSSENDVENVTPPSNVQIDEYEDDHEEEAQELVYSRGFMNEHCIRNGGSRYALKEVKSSLKGRSLLNGAIDICIEAKFLSVLTHPNIIKLCGMSQVNGGDPRTFLILDRLYDTLGTKITHWKEQQKQRQGGLFGAMRNKQKLQYLWTERLLAMYDIARAMKYLHSHQIMYRDLKPENAGFDIHGNVKLFDFGLAKELQPIHRIGDDLYRSSGRTGTRRYMSPENALCKPYGKSTDVYSFGILLWECLALKQPFEDMGVEQHAKLVVKGGKRPQIPSSWPTYLKLLITESWATLRLDRPDFDEICSVLKGELTDSEMNLSDRTTDLLSKSISNRELHGANKDL